MPRRIFRLEPAAETSDLNWDRAPNHGAVIVRADSPADARIVASQAEADFLEHSTKPGDRVSIRFASTFLNDKLYSVVEDESGTYPVEGDRAVLAGTIKPDILRLSQGD
jgi:hypothetical protein